MFINKGNDADLYSRILTYITVHNEHIRDLEHVNNVYLLM